MSRLTIIGAGIIGLSCAWAAQRRGWDVTIIDRAFAGVRVSHGNAGGIAVSECVPFSVAGLGLKPLKWLCDPLGPLSISVTHAAGMLPWYRALCAASSGRRFSDAGDALARLNNRSLADFETMLRDLGLAGDLQKRGALTVYESQKAYDRDQHNWHFRRERGVRWRPVDAAELRELEPGLAPVFARAIMIEDWAHLNDPKRVVDVLRKIVTSRGAQLISGEARALDISGDDRARVQLVDGTVADGDFVLTAAGAWSAHLARTVGDHTLLESERGYNTTLPCSATLLNREIIFAERMFVATPLSIGLRIGGAAEFAGLVAPPNFKRSEALMKLGRKFIPGVDETDARPWMGHRSTTPDTLPTIGASPRSPRLLYAFGHGHLGLTQSVTTAGLICGLMDGKTAPAEVAPYAITRFRHPIQHWQRIP